MLHNVEVTCPECDAKRTIKNWNDAAWGGPPFIRLCKKCCQLNQSEETRNKKSLALKGKSKPPEYSDRLKDRHEEDATLRENLVPGAGAGWNAGIPMDEETKKKISETMKSKNENGGEQ